MKTNPPIDIKSNFDTQIDIYAMKLKQNELPVIFSTKHLSLLIDIDYEELLRIVDERNEMYKDFAIKKKDDSIRLIKVPYKRLKYIQRSIYTNILSNINLNDSCHGFRKKRSTVTNASKHLGQRYLLKMDISNFFHSITEKRVYGMFKKLGYHSNLSVDLAKLCTAKLNTSMTESVLPQGSPSSPMISNIILKTLDKRLSGLAKKYKLNYSRYADDMTFSSEFDFHQYINVIKKIVQEEGFEINDSKTSFKKRGQCQYVTGISITSKLNVKKKKRNDIRMHLYYCQKYGVNNHLNKLEWKEKSSYRNWLEGNILYIKSANRDLGEKLMREFLNINWSEFDFSSE